MQQGIREELGQTAGDRTRCAAIFEKMVVRLDGPALFSLPSDSVKMTAFGGSRTVRADVKIVGERARSSFRPARTFQFCSNP